MFAANAQFKSYITYCAGENGLGGAWRTTLWSTSTCRVGTKINIWPFLCFLGPFRNPTAAPRLPDV